jgi:hypothetical protein
MKEKFIQYLDDSVELLKRADHMIYMTYPIVKEKKLMLKILNEIYTSILKILNSILQYEYFFKRINLYKDSKSNFQTFKEKCAPRYNITEQEIKKISEIFLLVEKHKNSPFEFVKKEKLVIMSENLHTSTLTIEKIKEFLLTAKQLLVKAEKRIRIRA